MHPIVPQIVGILAVATFLLSYQQKNRRAIIILNTVSRVLYIVQYILLGAFSGMALDVVGAVASVIAARRDTQFVRKHLRAVIISVDAVIVIVGILLYRTPIDLLPLFGVLLHTGAFWLTDERWIRRVSLAGSPFWLVYNLSATAYGSAIGDVLTMVSILLAMYRYRRAKHPNQSRETT